MTGLSWTSAEFCVCAKSRSYDGDVGNYQVRMVYVFHQKRRDTWEWKNCFFFCLKFMRVVQQGNDLYVNNLLSRTKQPIYLLLTKRKNKHLVYGTSHCTLTTIMYLRSAEVTIDYVRLWQVDVYQGIKCNVTINVHHPKNRWKTKEKSSSCKRNRKFLHALVTFIWVNTID